MIFYIFFFFDLKELHFVFQSLVLSLQVTKIRKRRKIEFFSPVREIEGKSEDNNIATDW